MLDNIISSSVTSHSDSAANFAATGSSASVESASDHVGGMRDTKQQSDDFASEFKRFVESKLKEQQNTGASATERAKSSDIIDDEFVEQVIEYLNEFDKQHASVGPVENDLIHRFSQWLNDEQSMIVSSETIEGEHSTDGDYADNIINQLKQATEQVNRASAYDKQHEVAAKESDLLSRSLAHKTIADETLAAAKEQTVDGNEAETTSSGAVLSQANQDGLVSKKLPKDDWDPVQPKPQQVQINGDASQEVSSADKQAKVDENTNQLTKQQRNENAVLATSSAADSSAKHSSVARSKEATPDKLFTQVEGNSTPNQSKLDKELLKGFDTTAPASTNNDQNLAQLAKKIDELKQVPVPTPAQQAQILELKEELKASISALPVAQQTQLKALVTDKAQSVATSNQTPLQLLEQIEESAEQVVTSTSDTNAKAAAAPALFRSSVNSAQSNDAKVSPEINVAGDDSDEISELSGNASKEQAMKGTELPIKPPVNPPSFENMIKALDNQTKVSQGFADIQPSQQGAASRLEQQESQSLTNSTTTSQTAKEQDAVLHKKIPLHQQFAANALKERVGIMVNGGLQQAVISLDPEELGAMSIRIQMNQDQMNVQFQVQNPAAKDMLEQAMVKLKDMLEQQGIALNQGDVEQQSQGQQQHQELEQSSESQHEFMSDSEPVELVLHKQSTNGVDYYA